MPMPSCAFLAQTKIVALSSQGFARVEPYLCTLLETAETFLKKELALIKWIATSSINWQEVLYMVGHMVSLRSFPTATCVARQDNLDIRSVDLNCVPSLVEISSETVDFGRLHDIKVSWVQPLCVCRTFDLPKRPSSFGKLVWFVDALIAPFWELVNISEYCIRTTLDGIKAILRYVGPKLMKSKWQYTMISSPKPKAELRTWASNRSRQ